MFFSINSFPSSVYTIHTVDFITKFAKSLVKVLSICLTLQNFRTTFPLTFKLSAKQINSIFVSAKLCFTSSHNSHYSQVYKLHTYMRSFRRCCEVFFFFVKARKQQRIINPKRYNKEKSVQLQKQCVVAQHNQSTTHIINHAHLYL